MAGITMSTALEVFTNPYDLFISIGQEKDGGKYVFVIMRGPGHDFKPLISTTPFFGSAEDAVKALELNLNLMSMAARTAFANKKGDMEILLLLADHGLSGGIDESNVLNPDLIKRIGVELRERRVAKTYEMQATATS